MYCSAGLPWPIQSQVESTMASEAEASLTKFLAFCQQLCEQDKAAAAAAAAAAPAATASQPAGAWDRRASEDLGGDLFYDARSAAGAGPQPDTEAWGAALQALQALQDCSARSAQHMGALVEQLRLMNSSLSGIKDAAGRGGPGQQRGASASWALLVGLAVGASAGVLCVRLGQRYAAAGS